MNKFDANAPSEDPDHHKPKKRKKKLANPSNSSNPSKPSAPRPSNDEPPTRRSKRRPPRAEETAIPSRDEIKMKLARLPVMLMTGMINTADANSMRAIFQTLLQADKADGATPVGGRELSVAVAALQADPRLAQLLEGFLTDDEIETLMRQADVDLSSPDESREAGHKPKLNLRKSGDEHDE